MTSVSVAGVERIALFHKTALERLEVLDDAVVDDGDLAVAAQVGVGVDVARRAVGGPAGVADARPAGGRGAPGSPRLGQPRFQPIDPPRRLAEREVPFRRDQGHAGTVVAAILQTPQPGDQVIDRLTRSNVSDDATHCISLSGRRTDCQSVVFSGTD